VGVISRALHSERHIHMRSLPAAPLASPHLQHPLMGQHGRGRHPSETRFKTYTAATLSAIHAGACHADGCHLPTCCRVDMFNRFLVVVTEGTAHLQRSPGYGVAGGRHARGARCQPHRLQKMRSGTLPCRSCSRKVQDSCAPEQFAQVGPLVEACASVPEQTGEAIARHASQARLYALLTALLTPRAAVELASGCPPWTGCRCARRGWRWRRTARTRRAR
jgi:hypothetical protein